MPSFRSSAAQAEHAVGQLMREGASRAETRNTSEISSYRTAENYAQTLKATAEWARENGHVNGLKDVDGQLAQAYLAERAELVSQKTLDQDRQALQAYVGHALERTISERPDGALGQQSRGLTAEQYSAVRENLSDRSQLSADLARESGVRASELHTIARAEERPANEHRDWREDRFAGREGVRYTVVGKGGLCREVLVQKDTAERLEACRRDAPVTVVDRGVRYSESRYDLRGGQSISNAFSKASNEALDRSNGFHGLRHDYAQERMNELQERGYSYNDAREVVSQELGHFRPEITEAYLR